MAKIPARLVFATFALMLLATPADTAETYRGACDASAAVSIGARHFLVAADEYNRPDPDMPGRKKDRGDFLLLFENGKSEPVQVFSLPRRLRDDDRRELDIEGAARIGQRIFWITSHGRNRKGTLRPSRYRVLATDFSGTPGSNDFRLKFVGSFNQLVPQMLDGRNWSEPGDGKTERLINILARATRLGDSKRKKLAPKRKGLNIEGLAVGTNRSSLLIGLRNPLIDGKAVVIELKNPSDLVNGHSARAVFGKPVFLDLNNKGIRAMEYAPDSGGFLLIAGPAGSQGNFALYKWPGPEPQGRQESKRAVKLSDLRTEKNANPEALIVYQHSQAIKILNDEGKKQIEGRDCNSNPLQKQQFSASGFGRK